MSDQAIAERVELDKKDKNELATIVSALGGKSNARMRKSDLIDAILELSGVTAGGQIDRADEPVNQLFSPPPEDAGGGKVTATDGSYEEQITDSHDDSVADDERDVAGVDAEVASERDGRGVSVQSVDDQGVRFAQPPPAPGGDQQSRSRRRRGRGRNDEPPAEWELEVAGSGDQPQNRPDQNRPDQNRPEPTRSEQARPDQSRQDQNRGQQNRPDQSRQDQDRGQQNRPDQNRQDQNRQDQNRQERQDQPADPGNRADPEDLRDRSEGEDSEAANRRRRRRGRGRDREDIIEPANPESVAISGYLDLRDEGYGFLRVDGYLPSRDDVYVPVKMVRQFGLRKGDLVTGEARAANRNERNPALQSIASVNGLPPEDSPTRPNFEDLTPLFPDERLRMERTRQPLDLTARVLDLLAPIGKGQRGLIVSPPKAGKTSIMKEIATSIETNHPEVELIVLLIDERPEEVTDMRRHLERGEVIASTFDRPTEEHCAIAELTIERAKRLVETGRDVVIILDGITRLARAYNMAANGTGRIMSGGVDAGALYPPKKFLGAARNLEEGGSLTILATALVETGSRMDEVIFEEFKGTGNMELRLDRGLAERFIFPAIDPLASSTRRPELLMDGREQHAVMKLRKVLAGLASDEGTAAAGMNLLLDRLRTFRTNAEFLTEIAKAP